MIRGFWSARSGLLAQQSHMDTIANNMANANTTAFKPMHTSFKDLMYQNMNRPQAEDTAMTGVGVKVNTNDLLMAQGAPRASGRAMDMCLLGDGEFFSVETPDGNIQYTRAGNFNVLLEDDEPYLVDGNGNYVLDMDGDTIILDYDENNRLVFDPDMVGVYRFPNAYGLSLVGSNNFVETVNSGAPEAVENPEYKAGYLEGSAVEIAVEMVNVIEASKAFSLNARMSQVADEIEQTVNSLR
jgi:flagellar basal-body rod protein FlgG